MPRQDVLVRQLSELQMVHPSSTCVEAEDGSTVVSLDLHLPDGWSAATCHVSFVLSPAYPSAQPDCFFSDCDLRLASGGQPSNSGIQPLGAQQRLWFSWHLQQPWSPTSHTLLTYVRFIQERFRHVR